MKKLQNDLQARWKEKIKVLTPKNCQPVRLKLVTKKSAKIIGQLAKQTLNHLHKALTQGENPMQDRSLQSNSDDIKMTDY